MATHVVFSPENDATDIWEEEPDLRIMGFVKSQHLRLEYHKSRLAWQNEERQPRTTV